MYKKRWSDQQYIDAICTNKGKIIDSFYEEKFRSIKNFVISCGGTYEDAKDVMQESMMRLFDRVRKENFTLKGKLDNYFFIICRNTTNEKMYHEKRFRNSTLQMDSSLGADDIGMNPTLDEQRLNILWDCLAELRLICRQIIDMRIQDMPHAEIAKKLKLGNASIVRRRKHTCLENLRLLIKKHSAYKNLNNDG
nr:sigma-70 family RNA polymerase sigma factor [Bacteroidota bacterium]